MSLKDKAKATAKDIEGKVQEGFGKVTNNAEAQVEGQHKQDEAKIRHAVEDLKDGAKKAID